MNGISLTASMRSNLLSLQNISGQVSSTQNKLATGNKVNSAIDNPSSYYTARSLNNRADDLNALLDSMGQAVSTIKAATTALESATEFLEQAKAVANQALETAKVPDKSFFEEKVGENGAVVTTAQELRDAIAAGKETICVYGAIDLGDISQTAGLTLQENQKLVGVGYFGNYDADTNKFSSISAKANTNVNMIDINHDNSIVSDLKISYDNNAIIEKVHAISIYGKDHEITLSDLTIETNFSDENTNNYIRAAIYCIDSATTNISGKINILGKCVGINASNATVNILSNTEINIDTKGKNNTGLRSHNGAFLNIHSNTQINIKTVADGGIGVSAFRDASVNIASGTIINIQTEGTQSYGITAYTKGAINISSLAEINIKTKGATGYGLFIYEGSDVNVSGNLLIECSQSQGIYCNQGCSLNIKSSAQLFFNTGNNPLIYNGQSDGANSNILDIAAGAKLAIEKNGKTDWYKVKASWQDKNTSTTTANTITADNIKDKLDVETVPAWELPEEIEGNSKEEVAQDLSGDSKQYQEILNQYDALIKDARYKGINLLQPERLTVKFNEDNTAALEVQGKDMSSKALGFTTFEWQTQGDINASIEELTSAINAIRNYSSELGNNYNIITTRQDFTESLVNVLTEGADKLTLADMNEESANMLALQTRQQLAINSLSLASQASQSILKLF